MTYSHHFRTSTQISVAISKRDVLRGLHTSTYSKLVNIICGAVYDVVVDFREESPTFGKWIANVLSAESKLISQLDQRLRTKVSNENHRFQLNPHTRGMWSRLSCFGGHNYDVHATGLF